MEFQKTIEFEGKQYVVVTTCKNPKNNQVKLVIKPIEQEKKYKTPTMEEILSKIGCC